MELADAFLSYNFLNVTFKFLDMKTIVMFLVQAQYEFLKSKGKTGPARAFMMIKTLRPIWSKLL